MDRPMIDLSSSIAKGFDVAVEEIIRRVTAGGAQVRFDTFTDLIMEMEFIDHAFKGKTELMEVEEITKEVFGIAKRYVLHEFANYEQSVAALFLLYCVVIKQPIVDLVKLRLTREEAPAFKRIEAVARNTRRLEVIYILGEILTNGLAYFVDDCQKYYVDYMQEKQPPVQQSSAPKAQG